MISELKKIKSKYNRYVKTKQKEDALNYVRNYVKENDLQELINRANQHSHSTGVDELDYAMLHQLVRTKKPKYVLECGTGRSTWIFAHALWKNHVEYGIEGKVISMESVEHWYNEAKHVFPNELRKYSEILYSAPTTFMHSFIKGTCYGEVPDLPYDIVFVDGPAPEVEEDGLQEAVNMDFIKVVLRSTKPVTGVIDYRLRTNIAYGLIFGREKVKFVKPWNIGIIEDVTRKDMILDGDAVCQKKILSLVTQFEDANPSWIKL